MLVARYLDDASIHLTMRLILVQLIHSINQYFLTVNKVYNVGCIAHTFHLYFLQNNYRISQCMSHHRAYTLDTHNFVQCLRARWENVHFKMRTLEIEK